MRKADPPFFPVVISAPSGGGKSAIRAEIFKADKRFQFSVTCTTRPKRKGEIEGKDYFFVDKKKFKKLRASRKLLEWAKVHGNLYGTLVKSAKKILKGGKIPLMTIDVKGARAVKKIFPETLTIFIIPPSLAKLKKRLENRRESPANMETRLKTAEKEIKEALFYEYLVVNDKLEDAVRDILKIADARRMEMKFNKEKVLKFGKELSRRKQTA